MLRLWLTRRWIVATVVAILFAVACWFLGLWQWHRHVEQRAKVAAIIANYDAPPVPLAAVWPRSGLPPEAQWTRVMLTGTYAVGADLLVRGRTLDQMAGFEVLTPFITPGPTVLVDRGWVPSGADAETAPPVDQPPVQIVELTGWLRSGEPSLGRDLPRPQLASINVAEARSEHPALADSDVYVVLGSQQPAPAVGEHPVRPLPRPEESLGPHQAYAFQWWLFMPGGLVFVVLAIRREAAASQLATARSDRAQGPGPEVEPRPREPARPKKVRIWDEEDS